MNAAGARASVLVTDAVERSVLAAIRSLDAAGYRVGATTHLRPAPGQWSRSCRTRHRAPDPRAGGDAYVARLEEIVRDGAYDALLAGSDFSLLAISEHRARIEPHVAIGLPDHEVVCGALSKSELARAAAEVGLDTPTTIVCDGEHEALAAARRLGFPVIAKSASTVIVLDAGTVRPDSRLLLDEASLRAWLAQQRPGTVLVQRREAGAICSCAGVMTARGLAGLAFARYTRTWPPRAGNASFAETLTPPDDLREQVAALIERMEWRGIFELELIERPDGGFLAIDLNPRVYGSLTLAAHAGAPLAALWCDELLGRAAPAPRIARAGVRYRWEEGEARNVAALARRGSWLAAVGILRPRRGCAHADFSLRDPAPPAARALLGVRRVIERRRTRKRSLGPEYRNAHTAKPQRKTHPATPPVMPDDPTPALDGISNQPGFRRRPGAVPASTSTLPVAIVGAGPYGLSVGAHLRDAGVAVRQFGRVMSYWREQMPAGMLLRSSLQASSISDPRRALRIECYAQATGRPLGRPIELGQFLDYGEWFRHETAPDLDERSVARVERDGESFSLTLDDGERVRAARVIVAAGLFPFARRPAVFDTLTPTDVSHASEHVDLSPFSGKRVAVIGSGQSALESAALLSEQGAEVEIVARNPTIVWLGFNPNGDVPPPRLHWPKPPTDVGGRVTGWIAAAPDSFRAIPSRRAREVVMFRCVRPAGAGWLRDRLDGATLSLGRTVVAAERSAAEVRLTLDDGTERRVDHVFLGTGYEIDVRRYPFLAPELGSALKLSEGLPVLGAGLESSIPGLHFVGAPAAGTFGPIMRFVVGTWYAAPAVARRIAGRRPRPLSLSY
jgi:FAD-dependent urate hydroxylase